MAGDRVIETGPGELFDPIVNFPEREGTLGSLRHVREGTLGSLRHVLPTFRQNT